jgi:hypothetical protein
MALAFKEEHCPTGDVGVDFERKAYKAFELKRGLASTFSPLSVGKALGAMRGGHRQGANQGDPLQQGGAFVIDRGGRIEYAYVSKRAGDHPTPEALLGALSSLGPKTA